jgi:hypothetical protein
MDLSRNAPASERGLGEAGDEVEQSPLALEQEFPGPLQPGYVQSQDGNPGLNSSIAIQ